VFLDGQLEITGNRPAGAPRAAERRARPRSWKPRAAAFCAAGCLSRAQVALVTNVSPDHFGEYGIDDLEGLADVKLSLRLWLARRDSWC